MHHMEKHIIAHKTCYLIPGGQAVVILLTHEVSEAILQEIYTQGSMTCTLVAVEAEDWFADYSPWPAEGFPGQGTATYQWLAAELLPFIQAHYPHQPAYLVGYSLAGLFALWSAYQGLAIQGVACCSGSLWYPKWQAFCQANPSPTIPVYLSVGGKEGKNPSMGDAVAMHKWQYQHLSAQSIPCQFDLNPGGHFAKIPQRLAKAITWLLP